MELKIVILSLACFSCLVPPVLSTGLLATKLAVGAAKGAAIIAIKGAILKGAALLAKGAAIKGAAVLAAKKALLGSVGILGPNTVQPGSFLAGSKLPLPPPYVLQKPSEPQSPVLQKPSEQLSPSQNPSEQLSPSQNLTNSVIGDSQKPSLVEIDITQKPTGAQVDIIHKPSDVEVNVLQKPSDIEIDVLQKPTDISSYNLQKPVEVEVYGSNELPDVADYGTQRPSVVDVNKPYSIPVRKHVAIPVSNKLPGIMGLLKSAIQNKAEAVKILLSSLQTPLFVKQPTIYKIINNTKYSPVPVDGYKAT